MAKLTLDFEFEYDFHLLGLSCHLSDYRIAWIINQALSIDLERKNDIELIMGKNKEEVGFFSLYQYDNPEQYITINLISNRCTKGSFCNELKEIDYFVQLWLPDSGVHELSEIHQSLKHSSYVNAAIALQVESLKSRNNFIF
jgi:hypothetical protein